MPRRDPAKNSRGLALAGLEQHDLDAPAGQFVGQRAAAGAGADDDDGV